MQGPGNGAGPRASTGVGCVNIDLPPENGRVFWVLFQSKRHLDTAIAYDIEDIPRVESIRTSSMHVPTPLFQGSA